MEPMEVSDAIFISCVEGLPDYKIKHQVFKGPTLDIGDLETIVSYNERENRIHSFWKPTEEELKHLNEDGFVELIIWADYLNPVSVVAWGGNV